MGMAQHRCFSRASNSAVRFLWSWEASPSTVLGKGGSLLITTAARKGDGRVTEDERMLWIGGSALVGRRRRYWPPGGGPRYGGIRPGNTSAFGDTIFSRYEWRSGFKLFLAYACISGFKFLSGHE